nr:MAG TPA: hypothetical protein [Bacteriophage sp.]
MGKSHTHSTNILLLSKQENGLETVISTSNMHCFLNHVHLSIFTLFA